MCGECVGVDYLNIPPVQVQVYRNYISCNMGISYSLLIKLINSTIEFIAVSSLWIDVFMYMYVIIQRPVLPEFC